MIRLIPYSILKVASTLFLQLLPTLASAQETTTPALPDSSLSLWGMIQQGGWAMYPLGLCSLMMFFLIFYSWKETSRKKFIPEDTQERVMELLAQFEIEETIQLLSQHPTVLSRVMNKALRRIKPEIVEMNKPKAEATLVEHLEAEENGVAQWVNYLNVVGAVAPMIGLLGTVSGMISAFQTIGQGGMGRPELLASDIGEALITTATGLIVGIPAMISYFVLRNRLSKVVVETSQIAGDLLDEIPVDVIFEDE